MVRLFWIVWFWIIFFKPKQIWSAFDFFYEIGKLKHVYCWSSKPIIDLSQWTNNLHHHRRSKLRPSSPLTSTSRCNNLSSVLQTYLWHHICHWTIMNEAIYIFIVEMVNIVKYTRLICPCVCLCAWLRDVSHVAALTIDCHVVAP